MALLLICISLRVLCIALLSHTHLVSTSDRDFTLTLLSESSSLVYLFDVLHVVQFRKVNSLKIFYWLDSSATLLKEALLLALLLVKFLQIISKSTCSKILP